MKQKSKNELLRRYLDGNEKQKARATNNVKVLDEEERPESESSSSEEERPERIESDEEELVQRP